MFFFQSHFVREKEWIFTFFENLKQNNKIKGNIVTFRVNRKIYCSKVKNFIFFS